MRNFILFVLVALPLALKSQSIDSSQIATRLDSLIKLALQLSQERKFEAAEKVIVDAKNMAIQTFGTSHFWHAQTLLSHGKVKNSGAKYVEAIQCYEQALAIKDPQWLNHVNYGLCIKGTAVCHVQLREYKNAEHYNFELIHFYDRTNHSEKLDYASVFYDLASLYRFLEDYEQSVIYCNKALAIWKEVYGKESVNYANSQFKIADVYCNLFLYVEAERMYAESRDILRRVLGPEHPDYAMGLQRIGIHYQVVKQFKLAESYFLEAKRIREKTIGKEHLVYGESLQALAQISTYLGKYKEAEQYYLECKQVREKALGKKSRVYAVTLINFAILYKNTGQFSAALQMFLEAKELIRNYSNYEYCLANLGDLYVMMNQFQNALEIFEELQEVGKKRNTADYFSQSRLGYGHYLVGNQEKALGILQAADSSLQAELVRAIQYLPESDLGLFAKRFYRQLDDQLSFTYHHTNPNLAELCFDQSLFLKGILLNTCSAFQRFINITPHARDKFDQLRTQQSLLALEYTKSTPSQALILEMEAKVHELQRDLSKNISGFSRVSQKVSWKDIQAKLKPGQAAIEFVHFNLLFPKSCDSVMYAALVVLPNGRPPLFIPLCEEKSLDSLIATQGERKADYVNGIYANDDRGITFAGKPSKTAYELLWKPLEKLLDGVTRVYYTPSGLLHRLNLGALSMPIAKQSDLVKVISDRVQMVQLNSTRQLALPHQTETSNLNAVLYGGIRYDLDSTTMLPNALLNGTVSSTNHRGVPLFSEIDTTLRGGTWGYLKWTEKEINNIAPVLKNHGFRTTLYQGYLGTEESFKAVSRMGTSPRVLHIATHGFFFPDPTTAKQSMAESNIAFRTSEHPMIRSGLVLAGGNHTWQNKPVRTGKEDGILTAYEISQMNLSNTELVVLSACETGLGDIQGNEGVYGLQRAFKIAGAKYLIMSLWQVPDFQTQELMVTFYQHWLERKMSIPDAFRAAQKEMREKYQHPYFWAGFVLVE